MKISFRKEMKLPIIEAENDLGLKATFCPLGASILEIDFNNEIMTVTPNSLKDFLKSEIYHGKTIGAIANRVKEGKVVINNKEYQLAINEGKNALHGGDVCLSKAVFDVKYNIGKTYFSVLYTFKMKNLRNGLPGDVTYYISYSLQDGKNDILIDMRAVTNKDTIVALTNHSYFCLGSSNLENLLLQIPASYYVHPNPVDLIPESKEEVTKILDFRKKKPILRDILDKSIQNSKTKGYDHHYYLDNNDEPIVLENKKYRLEIKTTFSGCQIYTDNYPNDVVMKNSRELTHRGIAIEPQDSALERKIITKNDHYQKQIIYSFFKK